MYANGWYRGPREPQSFHEKAKDVVARGYTALLLFTVVASTLFLVDTSASRALGMAEQGRILKQLAAGIVDTDLSSDRGCRALVVTAQDDGMDTESLQGGHGRWARRPDAIRDREDREHRVA